MKPATSRGCAAVALAIGAAAVWWGVVGAQDRLPGMPGYAQHQRMAPQIQGSWISGAVSPTWDATNRSFSYYHAGQSYRFDLATATSAPAPPPATASAGARPYVAVPQNGGQAEFESRAPGCPTGAVARGRQADCVVSPDGKRKAFYRDRNVWLANYDGSAERELTKDGSEQSRVKYGTASWVYGEELSQTTAIWWSPDGAKVGFYRFDESQVKDFYLQTDQLGIQDSLDVEAYPKAGAPNPIADVFVYDLASGRTTRIKARDGQPFANDVVGYYVYNIQWISGQEILINRANRRQQIMELAACSVTTGACRTVLHEEWLTGWLNTDPDARTAPSPSPIWLADHRHFIWESERTGWLNYYLYDLDGGSPVVLTSNQFDGVGLVKIDESAHALFYLARDGDNFMKIQLHRVGLDGRGDVRLTDPSFNHTVGSCLHGRTVGCGISPDDQAIVDVYQTHDQPPATQVIDARGHVVAQVTKSDLTKFEAIGFRRAELFSYKAADGKTTLYGEISFPSNFDPSKSYPTLVPVYGGPVLASDVPTESFMPPSDLAEYGFLVVRVAYRGVPGLGKRISDELYMKLGQVEMDDIALGVKALWSRPYFDRHRVGIFGTSYGAYTAAMEIVRHPDVFAAASASSPVTDWRNYDTIYTERYMGLPQENKAGYDAGSVMTYVDAFRGRLLLYYGTADNNVHPDNTMQLVEALKNAGCAQARTRAGIRTPCGKSFDLQVGPDEPHSEVNPARMMEFFIENLVVHPDELLAPQ